MLTTCEYLCVCVCVYYVCVSSSVLSPELHTHLFNYLLDTSFRCLTNISSFKCSREAVGFTLQTYLQPSHPHLFLTHNNSTSFTQYLSQNSRNQFLPLLHPSKLFTIEFYPLYLQNEVISLFPLITFCAACLYSCHPNLCSVQYLQSSLSVLNKI